MFIGSCYAFSVVAAIEGITQIMQRKLISLSEQQIVDCDKQDHGCNYGFMDSVYGFIQQNNGITKESYYPYTGTQGLCKYNFAKYPATKIKGFQYVPKNSEADLLKAVANQPITTGICGSDYRFRFYSSGIINFECSGDLDHAVTAVGYGTTSDGSKKYWIVKNSWGTNWGYDGYGYLLRDVANPEGTCGITTCATFPII